MNPRFTLTIGMVLAALPAGAQQIIPSPVNPWSASGTAAAALRPPSALEVYTSTTDTGTATPGSWSLSASGIVHSQALGVLNAYTRSATTVDAVAQTLTFSNQAQATVGALNLGNLLGAGLDSSWSAQLNVAGLDWDIAPNYNLSFNLSAPSGLVSDILTLGGSFNVSVLDGADNLVYSATGNQLLNLLGITVGTQMSNAQVNLNFAAPGGAIDGMKIRFEADALVDTSLLGIGSTVAQVSNLNVTAVPVPETGSALLGSLGAVALLGRRRRG